MSMLRNPLDWFKQWLGGYGFGTDTERHVTSEAALSYAPIWYGVNKISGHISQLPLVVYKRVDGGGEKQRAHSVARLMRKPNAYQTSVIFREQIAVHSILDGNGRAAIVRSGSRIKELIPLHPECTATGMIMGEKIHATRPPADDRVRLFFKDIDGDYSGKGVIMFQDSEVVHIPGLTTDGISGLPLRQVARRNLNMAIANEKRLSTQASTGFSGSLMLEAPPGMFRRDEDAENFLNYFEARHNSPDKAGKAGLLREGMKAHLLESSNRDSEMTANRLFSRQDAALWLGLEQILGDDSSVSYNSLEQKILAYLMNTLNRWLKRWEEEIECKLLPPRQFSEDTHYVRFNTAALLKADYQTSVESLAAAIAATIISPNEARQKLDMLPYEGGDVFQNPAITPGQAADTEGETPDEAEEAGTMDPATAARIEHLIGVEAKRVKAAAEKAATTGKNFTEWMDAFYGKWEPKLAGWLEEVGLDRDMASTHCRESKERLLNVLDYSSNETLAENIAKCVSTWHNRATTIGVLCHV